MRSRPSCDCLPWFKRSSKTYLPFHPMIDWDFFKEDRQKQSCLGETPVSTLVPINAAGFMHRSPENRSTLGDISLLIWRFTSASASKTPQRFTGFSHAQVAIGRLWSARGRDLNSGLKHE